MISANFRNPEYQTMPRQRRSRLRKVRGAHTIRLPGGKSLRVGGVYRRRRAYPKMRVQQFNTPLGGASSSLWSYGQKRRLPARVRVMKQAGAPDAYVVNGGFNCNVSQGTQKYYGFNSVTQGHLEDICQTAGAQSAFNRVVLENAIATLSLTNITNTSAELDIFDIIFKRDVPDQIQVQLASNLYTVNAGSVPDMINEGINAARTLAPAASGSSTIGTNAWDSQIFKEYCTVVKRTRVMLASGASHRHTSSVNLSKVIAQSVAGSVNMEAFKGYTFATLVRLNGAAAYVPSGEEATLGTPADITCQAVYSLRIKYSFIQDVSSNLTVQDILGDNFTAPGATTRNPGSGALEPVSP